MASRLLWKWSVELAIASRVLAMKVGRALLPIALAAGSASTASATDHIYFSATDNVTDVLVNYINAETVRLDISSWYLSEHSISIAVANRFAAGVPVRIIGDRGAPFENDPHTKTELYWLANQGIPIRLRFNPTWFPEIDHWKAAIFVGENVVEFGSGNFAPTELRPVSATNYCDETELFTDDPAIVNAFKTRFDVMWNDTTKEPESIISGPPYLKDWNDACAHEPTGRCADYYTLYPAPAPMVINTARLEPDHPTPPDLIWGQGPDFNNRLTKEINAENRRIDLIVYRLEVDNITQALLDRFRAGVPVRIIVDPQQYTNILWPEFWLTHANIDKLWAAGVPVHQRIHAGVTHMKTLVTSTYATNASSNFGPNWQRDHDYFVSAATKPAIYQAIADRVQTMWNDTMGFGPFQPTPPNAAALASPAPGATGVATSTSLVWNIAAWAVSYDVYLGTSPSSMTLVGNTPAQMVQSPPSTYSWTPSAPLPGSTTYYWRVVSRTNATQVKPSMIATSATWSFTTSGAPQPPAVPTAPGPPGGSTGISTSPTLTWSASGATSYALSFGTSNPPPPVANALPNASYNPGALTVDTTYFWQVRAINANGSTIGPVWSFTTDSPAIPLSADFDRDRRSDIVVFSPSTGSWDILKSATNYTTSMSFSWGGSGAIPVPGDYDGDGRTDPAVYFPATGQWWILYSSTGYTTNSGGVSWGGGGAIPVPGDYDGDGKTDPAVYFPSSGQWWILYSSTHYATNSGGVRWGGGAATPVPGDYDGDGMTDPAVFFPATGQWWILYSSARYATNSGGVSWGGRGAVPVPGDYDGDGKTDPAVYFPATGQWWILYSRTHYTTNSGGVSWGGGSAVPVPGDYDGDGKTDPAVFEPSTDQWWILYSSTGYGTNSGGLP
jgi:hypothetical protein